MTAFSKNEKILFIDEDRNVPDVWIEGVVLHYQDGPDEDGIEDYYIVKDSRGIEYFVTNDPCFIQPRSFGYCGSEDVLDLHICFDFSQALLYLKQGYSVSRKGWNGKNMRLRLNLTPQYSDGDQISPFIMIYNAQGRISVWSPSQCDLISDDWQLSYRNKNV